MCIFISNFNILKAKSNFTLLCTEYIYTRPDSKQIENRH